MQTDIPLKAMVSNKAPPYDLVLRNFSQYTGNITALEDLFQKTQILFEILRRFCREDSLLLRGLHKKRLMY